MLSSSDFPFSNVPDTVFRMAGLQTVPTEPAADTIRDVAQQTYQNAVQRMPTVLMYPDDKGVRLVLELPASRPAPGFYPPHPAIREACDVQYTGHGRTCVAAMLRALADAYDAIEVTDHEREQRRAELEERLATLQAQREEAIENATAFQQRAGKLRREIEEFKRDHPDIA